MLLAGLDRHVAVSNIEDAEAGHTRTGSILDIAIMITTKLPYLDATMRPTPECNGPGGNGRWWRSPRLLVAPARTGPFGSLTVQGPPTAT
jgi:hypothetical protein